MRHPGTLPATSSSMTDMTTDYIPQYLTPAKAHALIKAQRGMRYCLHLRIGTHESDGRPANRDVWTYMDMTRAQVLDVLTRLDDNPTAREHLICVDVGVVNKLVWIG